MKRLITAALLLLSFAAFGATAYIEEYGEAANVTGGRIQVAKQPPITTQTITYTTSTQSAAFNASTTYIRLQADKTTVCHFAFAASPTATASKPYIRAGEHEYFAVVAGQKVACYDGSS